MCDSFRDLSPSQMLVDFMHEAERKNAEVGRDLTNMYPARVTEVSVALSSLPCVPLYLIVSCFSDSACSRCGMLRTLFRSTGKLAFSVAVMHF